ncbi:MAG: hypothetical protein CND86_06100 [Bacteroidetes bacterium MED-G21]|nr:MAG: hypothetical protein CND86_06100 [Bacteroidetes bacterium MED-G21]
MKKYILALGILPLLFACSGSKKAAKQPIPETEVEVVIPCSGPDFFTNKKYFRANSIGESLDQVVSKKKALSNARADLAASVKILIESVVDNYVKSSELNNLEQVEERFEGLNREVIKQELVGIKTICEKLTKTTEGKFKTYIAIELSAQKLVDKFHERIMKDDLLMIDYDYEKFKDTFEKEMGKL